MTSYSLENLRIVTNHVNQKYRNIEIYHLLRDVIAKLLTEVCLGLQTLSGKLLQYNNRTPNVEVAHTLMLSQIMWTKGIYDNIKEVFNSLFASHCSMSLYISVAGVYS